MLLAVRIHFPNPCEAETRGTQLRPSDSTAWRDAIVMRKRRNPERGRGGGRVGPGAQRPSQS